MIVITEIQPGLPQTTGLGLRGKSKRGGAIHGFAPNEAKARMFAGAVTQSKGNPMAAVKIDFNASSWDKAKPKEVKGAKLSAALKTVEKAMADEKKKKSDPAAIEACLKAVEEAGAAAQDAMKKECDAKKHKDLVAALKKFDSDCKSEIKRLTDAKAKADAEQGEDGDDEKIEKLMDPTVFANVLKKVKRSSSASDGQAFCFCFHPSDGAACKLILVRNKSKIKQAYNTLRRELPKQGYKKNHIVVGLAYRDQKTLVLQGADDEGVPNVPGMAKKLKDWIRDKENRKNVSPMKKLRMLFPGGEAVDVDVPEDDDPVAAEAPAAGAGPQVDEPAAAAPAGPSDAAPTDGQAQPAQPATAGATDEAAVEDRRKEFKSARRNWQSVKEQAIQDLEAVKDGIRDYYLDDPEQFKIATGKLNQLDAIFDNLGDDLRDVLDSYVSTPRNRRADLDRLQTEATGIVERFLNYASTDNLLNAVDQKEFADVTVKAPIERALRELVKTLS